MLREAARFRVKRVDGGEVGEGDSKDLSDCDDDLVELRLPPGRVRLGEGGQPLSGWCRTVSLITSDMIWQ